MDARRTRSPHPTQTRRTTRVVRQRLCIGVDIGTSGVKVCQLRQVNKELRLVSYATLPFAPDTVVDGAVMNAGNVVAAVRTLFDELQLKERRVALAISGHSIIIKNVVMPRMERRELEASVQFEAEQLIPFAVKDVFLDLQILGPATADPQQLDVLLVAAKKDFVNEYTAVISEAGLEPVVCDVDAFAVQTAFCHDYTLGPQESVALVNIGAAKTSINVLAAGHSRFTRDLSVGGNNVTGELARALHVSFAEAEALKCAAATAPLPPEGQAALERSLHALTDEVVHSCEYFAASHPYPSPQKLFISGGTAQLDNLLPTLSNKVQGHCERIDPLRRIAAVAGARTPQLPGCEAAVAVGLAMRYVGDC